MLGVIGEELHSAYILTGVRLPLANFWNKSEENKIKKKRIFPDEKNDKNLIGKKENQCPRIYRKKQGKYRKKCFKRKRARGTRTKVTNISDKNYKKPEKSNKEKKIKKNIIYISIMLSIYQSIYLPIYLSIYPYIYLSIYLSIHISIYLAV